MNMARTHCVYALRVLDMARATSDGFTTPTDCTRNYRNLADSDSLVLVMTPGGARKAIRWALEVQAASAKLDRALHATGYAGQKRFADRFQH